MSLWPLIVLGPYSCIEIVNLYTAAGCGVFGRDETDSEFAFTQQQVDALVEKWSRTVRAVGWGKLSKPTSSTIMAVELCISDRNKPLLLANSAFIPYVVDALLLVRAWRGHLSQCTSGLRATAASACRLDLTTVAPLPFT